MFRGSFLVLLFNQLTILFAAARAVAELPGEDAAWVLQAATSDPDESVREEAAGAFELWQKRIR